jgi:hypothetical protein
MTCSTLKAVLAFVVLLSGLAPPAQEAPAEPAQSAEDLVAALYAAVTFEAGRTPDWDHVRSMFIEEALVVLRTSRQATTIFTVDGFVDDFVRFIEQTNAEQTGFTERVVRMKSMVFGDMAQVLVLYEASIPGSLRPPQPGVDAFSLIRRDGCWRIVSVTNEVPAPDRPLPAVLH